MTSTVTYYQNGIKVTKVTRNGHTTTHYGDTSPHATSQQSPEDDDFFDESSAEEKEPELTLRRVFFKALMEDDRLKLRKLYNFAKKNPKQGSKIFSPMEDDYTIDLSLFYNFNSRGDVISICENKFKTAFLMHYNFWKLYPKRSVTYIYVPEEQRTLARGLGYDSLIDFIEEHHIQSTLPTSYVKAYGSYLDGGNKNPDKGDYRVILKQCGKSLDTVYDITKLIKIGGSTGYTYSHNPAYKSEGSTFKLFSDNTSNDENPESTTETLFERHQMELQAKYGSNIDTEIAKLA